MIHPLAEVHSKSIGAGTRIWQFSVVLERAVIGRNCNINCHTFIENDVVIGNDVTIKSGVYLWDGISLEDNVMVAPNVTFTNDRRPRAGNRSFVLEKTIVKKGATIGAGAIVLCGLTIGEYAMVGAGSVITRSVPARALVVGNPARIIGWLNQDGTKMINSNKVYLANDGSRWRVINSELTAI